MIARHAAALAVAAPLGAASFLAGARELLPRRVLDALVLVVSGGVALTCAALAASSSTAAPYWFGGWVPRSGPALGIAFAPGAAGAGIAAFAALLVFLATASAAVMFEPEHGLFHVLVLTFLGGMTGFALTADLFNLFVFFELMGVAAFALTGWHADERGPLQGMMTFAVTNTVGSILFLLGTALLYGRTGALNLAAIGRALAGAHPDALVVAAFTAIVTALLVKLAVVPFHFWLPDAHAVAPAPVCALFSGIMVPLGAFGVVRIHAAAFGGALTPDAIGPPLAALAGGAAVVGAIMAIVQHHLKRMLAYSTVAHAGVLLAGVATMQQEGVAAAGLHLLGHGLLKAALFLCAGVLLNRFGSVDVRRLQGRGRSVPGLGVAWLLATAGLLDMGPTPTGPSAHLLDGALRSAGLGWLVPATAFATVVTGAALLRAGAHVFLGIGEPGPVDPPQGDQGSDEEPESREPTGRAAALVVPATAVVLAYALRCAPGLVEATQRAAASLLDGHAWAAWVLDGARAPASLARAAAVPLSTGAARGVLAATIAAILLARHRIPVVGDVVSGALHLAARPLERVHSGYVGDAVAWIGVGVAALGGWVAWGVSLRP